MSAATKQRRSRTDRLPMALICEGLGGGNIREGRRALARKCMDFKDGDDILRQLALERDLAVGRPLTPPEYIGMKVMTGLPEHSARLLARFLRGVLGYNIMPGYRVVDAYFKGLDVVAKAPLRFDELPIPSKKDPSVMEKVNTWSRSPVLTFIEIVLQHLQASGGKFEDLGWTVEGKKYLIAVTNTDKGGDSTKTLMSVVLSDIQDGQSTAVRIMTYTGTDDYKNLSVMLPQIMPGLKDLEELACALFTLKSGEQVVSFVPKGSVPSEAPVSDSRDSAGSSSAEPTAPSASTSTTAASAPFSMPVASIRPPLSFYESFKKVDPSPALQEIFQPLSFCTDGKLLSGLSWGGQYESPLSSSIELESVSSVEYFPLLTMYGGDLKLIFDYNGRCGGSGWHCAFCDWQRNDPLSKVCTPLTSEMKAAWSASNYKCFSLNTPPLHHLPVDRKLPCILHQELGIVPYNVSAIEAFGGEMFSASYSEMQRLQMTRLAALGAELAELLTKQAETSSVWVEIATPYLSLKEKLDEEVALQLAAPMQQRGNFDKAINLLKNKMRRSQDEVDALTKQQKDEAEQVKSLKEQLDTARLQVDPAVLASCDEIRALMKKGMKAVGSAPQVYFGGTALVGNDCKRILGECAIFLGILEEGIIDIAKKAFTGEELEGKIKIIKGKFVLWSSLFGSLDKFYSLANSTLRFTDDDLSKMDECLPIIKGLWIQLYGELGSAPPKIHDLLEHTMPFSRKYRFIVHGGEQIGEKEHARDNKHGRQLSSFNKQYENQERGKDKLRRSEVLPDVIIAIKVATSNTSRTKRKERREEENPGGNETNETKKAAKKKIKSEKRDNALAKGKEVLAEISK